MPPLLLYVFEKSNSVFVKLNSYHAKRVLQGRSTSSVRIFRFTEKISRQVSNVDYLVSRFLIWRSIRLEEVKVTFAARILKLYCKLLVGSFLAIINWLAFVFLALLKYV